VLPDAPSSSNKAFPVVSIFIPVTLVVVIAPAKVASPSTSSPVPFINFKASCVCLDTIRLEPLFLTAVSIRLSSAPLVASDILAVIFAYTLSAPVSLLPLNFICPK